MQDTDDLRGSIVAAVDSGQISLRQLSLKLGKNPGYFHHFINSERKHLNEYDAWRVRQVLTTGETPDIFMKDTVMDAEIIIDEREKTHGPADETFGMAAALVSALTFDRDWTKPFAPHEFAVINILHKVARIMQGSYHEDHWDDICGYALLGKGMHEKASEKE